MGELILTASRMEIKSRCDMRDFFSYRLGYKPAGTTKGLAIGTMVHKGLESFWEVQNVCEAMSAMSDCKEENPEFWDNEKGELAEKLAQIYVQGYYQKYQYLFEEDLVAGYIQNIETEKEFKFKADGITFAGKIDVLYQDGYGDPVIVEHKTTSSSLEPEGNYLRVLPMNIQLTIYRRAVQEIYAPGRHSDIIPDVIYDVIKTTGKKQSQKKPYIKKASCKTPEEYLEKKAGNLESVDEYIKRITPDYLTRGDNYVRQAVYLTREEQDKRMSEIIQLEKQRPSNNEFEERVRNTSACSDYGGCPFIDVCLGRESLDSELFVKKERIHPELTII